MKSFSLLLPLLAALPLASASALLPRDFPDFMSVDPRVAKCATSVPCTSAASSWTECSANAKKIPSNEEIDGGGVAECLCKPDPAFQWQSNPPPAGRIFRPQWESELIGCIECFEHAFGNDDTVSTSMKAIIESATSSPLGFCVVPDEFGFRQRSRELKDAHSFPLLLPMATLPPPPAAKRESDVEARAAAAVLDTRQGYGAGVENSWVGPVTTKVQTCLDTYACKRSQYLFKYCMEDVPNNEDATVNFNCLCGYSTNPGSFRPEWFGNSTGENGLAGQCATCISKAVPGATDLTINTFGAISTYCYNPVESADGYWTRNQMIGWASNTTFTYKVPVTLLNYTIQTKTPWTIPEGFLGSWGDTNPW